MKPAGKVLSSLKALRQSAETHSALLPPLMVKAEKAAASVLSGDHTQRKSGMGEKFWQFREYDPTDRPQDIDWRQSAKGDRVFVRQKEWQTTQTSFFWRSGGPGMAYRSDAALPTKAEAASVISLALGILMTRAGEQVCAFSGKNRPGRTERALENLGRDLLEDSLPLNALGDIKLPRNSNIVLISDFLEPIEDIEEIFKRLAATAGSALVIQTLDPAEITLPFSGRAFFEHTGHDERHLIANVDAIRARYQERIKAHQESLRSLCRRLQWHWLEHRTDASVSDTLLKSWLALSPESHRGGKL